MAPAIARAQSAPEKAIATMATADRQATQLIGQRGQLYAHLQEQLTAIDRLKNQKASWRRDRELQTAQADANDTAAKVAALDKQIASAQQSVANARAQAIAA